MKKIYVRPPFYRLFHEYISNGNISIISTNVSNDQFQMEIMGKINDEQKEIFSLQFFEELIVNEKINYHGLLECRTEEELVQIDLLHHQNIIIDSELISSLDFPKLFRTLNHPYLSDTIKKNSQNFSLSLELSLQEDHCIVSNFRLDYHSEIALIKLGGDNNVKNQVISYLKEFIRNNEVYPDIADVEWIKLSIRASTIRNFIIESNINYQIYPKKLFL